MSEFEQPQKRHHNDAPVAHRQPPQPKPKLVGEPYDPWAGKEPHSLAKGHAVSGNGGDRPATGRASRAAQERKPAQSGGGSRAAIEPNRGFGEHIVGSTSTQTIHMPWNLADDHASARFHVSGAGFELLSPFGEVPMPPSGTMQADDLASAVQASPKIQFAPDRPGAYHGELSVEIRWRDGHVETKTVALHGRARTLAQAPAAYEPENQAEPSQAQVPQLNLKDPKTRAIDRASSAEFTKKVTLAANAAGALAGCQQIGVEIVSQEQATYQKPQSKIPRSILWDLAEVALTMGTAGVATVVTKTLLPKVIAQIARKDEAQELGNFAAESIKEGIKVAGKAALQKTLPQDGVRPKSTALGEPLSSNPRIEFFARQENVLVAQDESNRKMVATFASSLQPLVATQPDQAITLLNALEESFQDAKQRATENQSAATSTQWVTAVARASLGTEGVATSQSAPNTAPLTAVKTGALRPTSPHGTPAPVAGVLDVYLNALVTEPKVVGAKLHGVAQEIADRLDAMELSNTRLPIRFIVGVADEKPIIITRDEAGRVLVHDAFQRLGSGEVQIAAAEALIHNMLSSPLSSWGVEIKSDDDSGRK